MGAALPDEVAVAEGVVDPDGFVLGAGDVGTGADGNPPLPEVGPAAEPGPALASVV